MLTALDGWGRPLDFVASGPSAEEQQGLEDFLSQGLLDYQYLSALERPLRVGDDQAHVASLVLPDFSPVPIGFFLAAPVRQMGNSVGTVVLAKDEPVLEFSDEDEETLVMFASQAGPWSSPTPGNTGRNGGPGASWPTCWDADGSWAQLLGSLTFRRSDGRVVSLDELTVYEALGIGETVRAEEVSIDLPNFCSRASALNPADLLFSAP